MTELRKTRDGSFTLYSERYRQTFHSVYGAVTESLHVFLEGTGVLHRLAGARATRILEVGFGTGLNFFLTADRALASNATLEYWSLERELLPAPLFASLGYETSIQAPDLISQFIAWRASLQAHPAEGLYTFSYSDTLHLYLSLGDAASRPVPGRDIDAVYLDAFSPDANPELWSPSFLAEIAGVTKPGGRLATYSARGLVRRNLMEAGFQVSKAPGPPGKREMIVAIR